MMPARATDPVMTTAGSSTRGDPVGPVAEGRGPPACPPCAVWGAAASGWDRGPGATSTVVRASSRGNTGEPVRDGKEGGEEAGREPHEDSKALQAVRWGRVWAWQHTSQAGASPAPPGAPGGDPKVGECLTGRRRRQGWR